MNGKRASGRFSLQLGIAALLLFIGASQVSAGTLSGDEIRQLISGNTVEAIHAKLGHSIITYYSPDGTYRQIADGESYRGRWSIDNQGKLCNIRDNWGGECRLITREGKIWKAYKVPDNPAKPRTLKRVWNKIIKGNPRNL